MAILSYVCSSVYSTTEKIHHSEARKQLFMAKLSQPPERRRGTILSSQGWQRLQAAERLSSIRYNQSKPYTLEQLSQITSLSTNTITKLRRRQEPVDWQTLEIYFAAFGLNLELDDVLTPEKSYTQEAIDELLYLPFQGPLTLDNPFYIYRGENERLCVAEICRPGALLKIEAPSQFGKTSLALHAANAASDRGFRTSMLSLQGCNQQVFQDVDRFYQWFCAMVATDLGLPHEISQRWDTTLGSSYICSAYFETYLLPADPSPLVLVIDELDQLFAYPELARDFFGMLRSWYERGHSQLPQYAIWQRLRLILIRSTTTQPLPWNFYPSLYNVGLCLQLSGFTWKQVEDLTHRYDIQSYQETARTIFSLVGGHPYLTQLCLFHLSQENVSLSQLSENAIALDSIFSDHLQQLLKYLEQQPSLLETMRTVARHPCGMEISVQKALQLRHMGLIQFRGQLATPSCELYRRYFGSTGVRFVE